MQVRVEELSPVEKKLAVEIEWPMVSAKLDKAYKELSRDVALKGFRKGKVPREMLERMFSRQVEQEVVKDLVNESFLRAATEHEIRPVAEPIVEEIHLHKGAPFRYSARIEVRAPIEPKDYDGIELERPEPSVSVEEIDKALERKREELAEYKQIEGRDTLGPSDVALCDVVGEMGGKPIKRDALFVDLAHPESEPVVGLAKALLGLPIAAKDHTIAVAGGVAVEGGEAPAQTELKVTIREAREKQVPALDDDLAKDTGEADSLDELRGKIRENLKADKEKESKRDLEAQLVKELIKRNPFDVAPSLVERQAEVLVRRARLTMAMQGVDPRTADETKLKDSVKDSAADEVRAALLLEAIADQEKVEVNEAELEKKLAEMAKQRDTSVQRLKAELQKEGRYEGLKYQLREEKTLDLLLTRANIRPKSEGSSTEK